MKRVQQVEVPVRVENLVLMCLDDLELPFVLHELRCQLGVHVAVFDLNEGLLGCIEAVPTFHHVGVDDLMVALPSLCCFKLFATGNSQVLRIPEAIDHWQSISMWFLSSANEVLDVEAAAWLLIVVVVVLAVVEVVVALVFVLGVVVLRVILLVIVVVGVALMMLKSMRCPLRVVTHTCPTS